MLATGLAKRGRSLVEVSEIGLDLHYAAIKIVVSKIKGMGKLMNHDFVKAFGGQRGSGGVLHAVERNDADAVGHAHDSEHVGPRAFVDILGGEPQVDLAPLVGHAGRQSRLAGAVGELCVEKSRGVDAVILSSPLRGLGDQLVAAGQGEVLLDRLASALGHGCIDVTLDGIDLNL